jgi:hypothetical protein
VIIVSIARDKSVEFSICGLPRRMCESRQLIPQVHSVWVSKVRNATQTRRRF